MSQSVKELLEVALRRMDDALDDTLCQTIPRSSLMTIRDTVRAALDVDSVSVRIPATEPPKVCTGSFTVPPELQGKTQAATIAAQARCGICGQLWPVSWSMLGAHMTVHPYPIGVAAKDPAVQSVVTVRPADPIEIEIEIVRHARRDLFAASAMRGLLSNEKYEVANRAREDGVSRESVVASDAVDLADALIAALEKRST